MNHIPDTVVEQYTALLEDRGVAPEYRPYLWAFFVSMRRAINHQRQLIQGLRRKFCFPFNRQARGGR